MSQLTAADIYTAGTQPQDSVQFGSGRSQQTGSAITRMRTVQPAVDASPAESVFYATAANDIRDAQALI